VRSQRLAVWEIYTSTILIVCRSILVFIPVDRELAYESLKWIDPKVYRAYMRLKYREITDEEFQKDSISYYKLRLAAQTLDVLDSLEQRGVVEIVNDYENEQIRVRMNQYNNKRDEHGAVV